MPLIVDKHDLIKTWNLNDKEVSVVNKQGKAIIILKEIAGEIEIPLYNISGIPSHLFTKPEILKKFLEDSYIKLAELSNNEFKLYVYQRGLGGGNTIDPEKESKRLWPNAIIPYEIDIKKYPVDEEGRGIILKAIEHWQQANTGFTFVPRTTEEDYVIFGEEEGSCYSLVGKNPNGGPQYTRCDLDGSGGGVFNVGSIAHEIGHIIGLYHEHAREDRDKYVKIVTENIKKENSNNFNILKNSKIHGPYDYDSIMHYGAKAFSIDGSSTIIPKNTNNKIGQRARLSQGDINAARHLANTAKRQRSSANPRAGVSSIWNHTHTQTIGDEAANKKPVWHILYEKALRELYHENYEDSAFYFQALIREYQGIFNKIFSKATQAIIYNNFGLCLEELGHHEEALDYFEIAYRLYPTNAVIQQNLEQINLEIQARQTQECCILQ